MGILSDISDYKSDVPILNDEAPNSFKREYNFKWELSKASQTYSWMSNLNNSLAGASNIADQFINIAKNGATRQNVTGVIMDTIAQGKMTAAYNMFALNINIMMDVVSGRAETVQIPDDEIAIKMYEVGNVKIPVAESKEMHNVVVTYVEDKYNNVYNFHKIWQECLRPGNDLCFMDIPSFSITGTYITTDDHLTVNELNELYGGSNSQTMSDKVKEFSRTVYPLLFPIKISRGTANATSQNTSRVTVTYVRTPLITKTKALTRTSFSGIMDVAKNLVTGLRNF